MKKPFIEVVRQHISGIKCDTPGCDYHDDTAKFEEYQLWLHRPCPKCGRSLLTEADMRLVATISHKVNRINIVLNRLLPHFVLRKLSPEGCKTSYSVSLEANGSGRVVGIGEVKKNAF